MGNKNKTKLTTTKGITNAVGKGTSSTGGWKGYANSNKPKLRNGDYAVRGRDTLADAIQPREAYVLDDLIDESGIFNRILNVQSVTHDTDRMAATIIQIACEMGLGAVKDSYGNIYVVKGESDSYPTFVAHIDTVHDIISDYSVGIRPTKNDYIISAWDEAENCPTGVGGDDKVGIYIALKMMQILPVAKAAFFLDEEWGCLGSERADMTFFDDSRFVLQADRKGNGDFIDYIGTIELLSDDFGVYIDPIIRKYGRGFKNGGITDVMMLKERGLRVACANMSCGYYEPHSVNEYVSWNDVIATLSMVCEIATGSDKVFGHLLRSKPTAYASASSIFYGGGGQAGIKTGGKSSWDGAWGEDNTANGGKNKLWDYDYCQFCYDEFIYDDLIEIADEDFLCRDCFEQASTGKSAKFDALVKSVTAFSDDRSDTTEGGN